MVANTSGQKREFRADLVVHAAGRIPEIDDLDLGAAGVESDERGVTVNEFLQLPAFQIVDPSQRWSVANEASCVPRFLQGFSTHGGSHHSRWRRIQVLDF